MLTYEKIKTWCKDKENKNKVVVAAGFVVIFFVGFGTGRYEREMRRETYKPQVNYTTKAPENTATQVAGQQTTAGDKPVQAAVPGADAVKAPGDCLIKGNISSAGKKIYHVKGGAFYDRTNAEQCFNTQAEAVAAGYVKSSR